MPLLQLVGVSKKFGQVVVAEDVTLEIEQGDARGHRGSQRGGQDIAVRHGVGRHHSPTPVTIRFDGRDARIT